MPAVFLALVSSLTYGFADFAGGLATRGAHVLRVVAITAPVSFAAVLLWLPLLGERWSVSAVAWGAASGVTSAAAFTLLYQCLALGPMGVLSPITAVVSAVLPVSAGILLGERLDAIAVAGVVLALVAVLIISASGTRHERPSATALALAVGAGAAIAAQLIFLNQSPADSGVTPLVVGRAVAGGVVLASFLLRRHDLPPTRPRWSLAVGAGVLDALANLAFLYATREGSLAVVAVIASLYPAGTVLLARFTLGERLTRSQVAGLGLAAVAVSLLAVG